MTDREYELKLRRERLGPRYEAMVTRTFLLALLVSVLFWVAVVLLVLRAVA